MYYVLLVRRFEDRKYATMLAEMEAAMGNQTFIMGDAGTGAPALPHIHTTAAPVQQRTRQTRTARKPKRYWSRVKKTQDQAPASQPEGQSAPSPEHAQAS